MKKFIHRALVNFDEGYGKIKAGSIYKGKRIRELLEEGLIAIDHIDVPDPVKKEKEKPQLKLKKARGRPKKKKEK